jgi:hypothetical protein
MRAQWKFRPRPVSGRAFPANKESIMNDSTNLPAPLGGDDDDGFHPIVPTDDRVIVGTRLKFVDGVWSENDIKVPAGTKLLTLSTHQILQRYDQERFTTITKKPLPDPDELNAKIPQSEWPIDRNGNRVPPWKLTYVVYLLDPRTCEKFTYISATIGARIATETFADRVAWMRRLRGNNVVPLVELTSKQMKTRFGTKQRPEFKIDNWHLLGDGGAPEQLALPRLTPVEPPSTEEELDDEIPL